MDSPISSFLVIGDDRRLQSLEVLEDVSLCGFPAEVTLGIDVFGISTGTFRPRATCLNGSISSLRPFEAGEAATPENTALIQYDLSVRPGTSGSAVFDSNGVVIGVNAFGFEGTDFNFGIRGDVLVDLLDQVRRGGIPPAELVPRCGPEVATISHEFAIEAASSACNEMRWYDDEITAQLGFAEGYLRSGVAELQAIEEATSACLNVVAPFGVCETSDQLCPDECGNCVTFLIGAVYGDFDPCWSPLPSTSVACESIMDNWAMATWIVTLKAARRAGGSKEESTDILETWYCEPWCSGIATCINTCIGCLDALGDEAF